MRIDPHPNQQEIVMSLSKQTKELTEKFISGLSQDDQSIVLGGFEEILQSDFGMRALSVGDRAADFSLPNARGGEMSLADLLDKGSVVLNFYRGGWCPYCNLEFKALCDVVPRINQLGGSLVGISPELPDNSMKTAEVMKLNFDVLSDVGNAVSRDYGIVMNVPASMRPLYLKWGLDVPAVNGDDSWELPIPATYVIDQDGIITFAYINKNYTERCEPAEIITALEKMSVVV
jgi:peroxiredoxin